MNFIVETSARHVHVSQEDLETLFGKGYELTRKKDLSQPGQYACNEKVTIVGSKKEMAASILGAKHICVLLIRKKALNEVIKVLSSRNRSKSWSIIKDLTNKLGNEF